MHLNTYLNLIAFIKGTTMAIDYKSLDQLARSFYILFVVKQSCFIEISGLFSIFFSHHLDQAWATSGTRATYGPQAPLCSPRATMEVSILIFKIR